MTLILITILGFALVAGLIYLFTELLPKRRFLKRHQIHKRAFEQFDIVDKEDHIDQP